MHFNPRIYRFLSFLVIFFLNIHAAYASLSPRISLNGYTSDYTVAEADLMWPIEGNAKQNFYINPQWVYGSDNQNTASLGVGYRWLHNAEAIYGAYLFGGYARIPNNARVWIVNPGVEVMGRRWDVHLNAYVPIGDRRYSVWDTAYYFADNSLYEANLHAVQEVGNGADVKWAYQLSSTLPLKAYVGSYFFSPARSENIVGGAVGAEYWLDNFLKLFTRYSYDNLHHSTVAIGIGLEWGGTRVHRANPALRERLTDPVAHYLANLGYAASIPSRKTTPQVLGSKTVYDNIAFFSHGAPRPSYGYAAQNTTKACTYENPCGPADFNQENIDSLQTRLPHTQLYFSGGAFSALNKQGNAISLKPGQSIHGRTLDYTSPAAGNARTRFDGGFELDANTALTDIILKPAGRVKNGIVAEEISHISIMNSQIGSPDARFEKGIKLDGVSGGMINNTSVFTNKYGIELKKSNAISIQSSQLSIFASKDNDIALGITVENGTGVNITDSSVDVVGNSKIRNAGIDVIDAQATINRTAVRVGSGLEPQQQFGISVSGDSNLAINDSSFKVAGASDNIGIVKEVAGANTDNKVNLCINNTTITVGTATSQGMQVFLQLPDDSGNRGSLDMFMNNSKLSLQGTDANSLEFVNRTKNNWNANDKIHMRGVICMKNGRMSACE